MSDAPATLSCPQCGKPIAEGWARFCSACGHRLKGNAPRTRMDADPLIGRVIAERYRIDALLGRGGMGVVYRVEHVRIGKFMAMKLLAGDLARDREVVARFRREAEAASRLDHENTVQVFDFGQAEGMSYLVMELLSGADLGELLQNESTISFARTAHIVAQVCGSLGEAHAAGLVHRDLKPENIRVLPDRKTRDFVKVLDFGLAKLRDEQPRNALTQNGIVLGTPLYMAPEQIQGGGVDARADLYALGAVMYRCIVGAPPFWAPTAIGVLTAHLNDPVIPPSVRTPRRDVPPEADRIIARCLAKDPADRFAAAEDLRLALERYLESLDPATAVTPGRGFPATFDGDGPPTVRLEAVATRSEVDRFEQGLRRAERMRMASMLVLGVAGLGAAIALALRPAPEQPPPTLEQEPNDQGSNASPLRAGTPREGYLGARSAPTAGDQDVWAFEVDWEGPTSLEASAIPNIDLAVDVVAQGTSAPLIILDSMPLGGPERAPNLGLPRGRYFARVREVSAPNGHPTENVSDRYSIRIAAAPTEASDEHEWNDAQAELWDFRSPRTGYIGWGGDRDRFCGPAPATAGHIVVTPIASLDLVLRVEALGVERAFDSAPRGAGEEGTLPAGSAGETVCVQVQANAGAQLGDASNRYTLRLE